jgi:flagellar basal-body rod modification protein FlgD
MSSIDATSAASAAAASTAATTNTASSTTGKLGQDAFLKLLVTQLEHQDPSKPIDDSQFISQLATFSSLEKLTQIADATAAIAAVFQSVSPASTSPTTTTPTTTTT